MVILHRRDDLWLIERPPKAAPGPRCRVHLAYPARAGLNDAARIEAEATGALLVDLARLDGDLRAALLG